LNYELFGFEQGSLIKTTPDTEETKIISFWVCGGRCRIEKTYYADRYHALDRLPDELQEQLVEYVRAYIAEIEEEKRWDQSFKQTKNNLVVAARKAKEEIAAGLSAPMDYEQL